MKNRLFLVVYFLFLFGAMNAQTNQAITGLFSVGKNCDSRHRVVIKAGKNQDGLRILDSSDTTRLWQTNFGLSVGSWVKPPRAGLFVTGNVGIGEPNPRAKLHVKGKIICEEELKVAEITTKDITVEMNNAADYVFDEDYNLKSLSEVEEYVKENKHLPGVPSASEMADKGVSVSEMSNLLLEKIEELTLHLIRLEKENKELKSLIEGFNK